MFKFLILILIFYLIFRFIRGIFKGLFIITKVPNPSDFDNSRSYSRSGLREKDISDRARILDEDKKTDQIP